MPQLVLAIVFLTIPLLTVFVFPRVPWWLARYLAIPLGMPTLAWQLSRLAPYAWKSDPQGGPLLAGAWALLYQKTANPDFVRTLELHLSTATHLGAASIVASALLRAYRKNLPDARELLESVENFERKAVPTFVQQLATNWLMADALWHGQWERAYHLGMRAQVRSRSVQLLTKIAARLTRNTSPSNVSLRCMWWITPYRRKTRPLLVRALATPQQNTAGFETHPSSPQKPFCSTNSALILDKTPLQRALIVHAYCNSMSFHPSQASECLRWLCEVWQQCFQQAHFKMQVSTRAQALGVKTAPAVIFEQFKQAICQQIAALAQRCHGSLDSEQNSDNEIIQIVSGILREQLSEQIEQACERLTQRVQEGRKAPAIEEWRAWIHVQSMCEQARLWGGLELRRLLFPQVHRHACGFAVWLWNQREEYKLAMPIFQWLLAEAQAVGDEAAIELQRKNIGAGG